MKICPNCSARSLDSSRYCPECGFSFAAAEAAAAPVPVILPDGVVPAAPIQQPETEKTAALGAQEAVPAEIPAAPVNNEPAPEVAATPVSEPVTAPVPDPAAAPVVPQPAAALVPEVQAAPVPQPYAVPQPTVPQNVAIPQAGGYPPVYNQPVYPPQNVYVQPGYNTPSAQVPVQGYIPPTYVPPGAVPTPVYIPPQYVSPKPQGEESSGGSKAVSIVSLIMGILGVFPFCMMFVFSIAAIVTGIISVKKKRGALGLVGLILGAVGLLLGIMFVIMMETDSGADYYEEDYYGEDYYESARIFFSNLFGL